MRITLGMEKSLSEVYSFVGADQLIIIVQEGTVLLGI